MVLIEILYSDDSKQTFICKSCIEQNGALKLNVIKYCDPHDTVYISLNCTGIKYIRVSNWSEADDARDTDIHRQLNVMEGDGWSYDE